LHGVDVPALIARQGGPPVRPAAAYRSSRPQHELGSAGAWASEVPMLSRCSRRPARSETAWSKRALGSEGDRV